MKKIIPMSKETFEKLKEFGNVSSFGLYARPDGPIGKKKNVKSNTGDMSLFSNPDFYTGCKDGVVFIALNASVHNNRKDGYTGPWANFHSDDNGKQHDFRLRHALLDSSYEGCYITDVIKNHPEKDAAKVKEHIKEHPEVLAENLEVLRRELSYFQQKPLIVALGNDAFQYLQSLNDEFTVIKCWHMRYAINLDTYRDKMHGEIEEGLKA